MMTLRFNQRFFIFSFLLIIAGCRPGLKKSYTELKGFTQGTTYSIKYSHPGGKNFQPQIDSILAAIDTSMSVYNPASVITAFNESEKGAAIDPMLAHLVGLSLAVTTETNAAFDITVGPLAKAWGFHAKRGEIPTAAQVAGMIANIGSDKIWLSGNFLGKTNPQVMIDVNAIAQGYTVDVIGEFFERNGVADYMVEVGGEVRTYGMNPRGNLWVIGIEKPIEDAIPGELNQVKIAFTGKSLATSGNYRKFYERDGVKYSHTIDPKTGYPVIHSLLSATVVDKTGARADALATAFMVMGLEPAKEWLRQHPDVEAYLIYSDSLGEFQVWMTHGMSEMVID